MSYDPSHHRPPRQERWPSATPPEGWPSYRDGGGYRDSRHAGARPGADRQGAYPATAGYRSQATFGGSADRGYRSAVVTDDFAPAGDGYGYQTGGYAEGANGYAGAAGGFDGGYGNGSADNGYASARNAATETLDRYAGTVGGLGGVTDGFDGYNGARGGYGQAVDEYPGGYDWDGNGYAAQLGPGSRVEYTEPAPGDPRLVAPDAGIRPGTFQDDLASRREARERGTAVGAVTVLLATAVATGVSTLAAAFVRPQVAPASAMGSVLVDRVPAALRHALTQHFGASGHSVLLLGMYAVIAVVALVTGGLARRSAALGVAAVAVFTVVAAFVAVTRPGSHSSAVAPALAGGAAGVAALLWLVRASAPMTPLRHNRGGARRRAR